MIDEDEIRKCWELLPHPPGSIVRVFARDRETNKLDGDFARNVGEMIHFARVHERWQVYVCPNPSTGTAGVRHTAAQVSHWSYILIDCDPIEDVFDPEPALEEALLWLGEWNGRDFGPKGQRPFIIDSGRGRQAWVRLQDVVLNDAVEPGMSWCAGYERDGNSPWCSRVTARRVNGYWLAKLTERVGMCHGCKVDTSTSDLPRPMRMPGTFNQKTGRMARIIEPSGVVFCGLATLLTTGVPATKLVDPPAPTLRPGLPWQLVQHRLTLTAKEYLKKGQEEPGRHKVMWHTARRLKELGVERAEARRALAQANKRRGDEQSLSAEEIEHALDTAYNGGS
jgi:hypothetical protein